LSRRLNKRCDNLDLVTPHRERKERAAPNHKTMDRTNMENIRTTSQTHNQRRTPERKIKILGSGATSIKSPRIILLIFSQSNHWWLR
jgi:hypothetical protein